MRKRLYIQPISEIIILQGGGIMQEGFMSISDKGGFGAPKPRRDPTF